MNSAGNTGTPEALEESNASKVDFRQYWRTIRKRWPFIGLAVIVGTVIAFVLTYRQPKIYEATCQIVIEPMAPQVLPGSKDVVELGTGTFWANREFYETQYRIIQSTAVGQRTAEKLGLQYDPDFAGAVGPGRNLTDLGRSVAGRLSVKPLKDSRLALITVEDTKPQRAALIANTVADTYIEYNLDYKLEGARSAISWLAEQEADLIILSDYGKGGLAHITTMIERARAAGKAVLVDPKGEDYARYRGATILTPNRGEFRQVVGRWANESELSAKAEALRRRLGLDALLVTRAEEGMSLFSEAGALTIPAQSREVFDVSGAGDTVIATLGVLLAAGASLPDAVRVANEAAGVVVGKFGTAVVHPNELS